jgi:hypothetical protein
VSIFDEYILSVLTNKAEIEQIYKALQLCDLQFRVVANFDQSGKPAILFRSHERTLYLLFDLKALVYRLTRLEDEHATGRSRNRFLASYHTNETRWRIPILDLLANLIKKTFEWAEDARKYGIIITHDVDRVRVEPLLLIKKVLIDRKILAPPLSEDKDFLFQGVKGLIGFDSQQGIKPIWFFLSGRYSFKRYGNRYSSSSMKVRKLISAIERFDHAIGLHTSFYGAFNIRRTLKEKEQLERILGKSITINRNHYLRFDIRKSIAVYENCGLKVDSSIGYADANGFRCGLCRPFYPWNYEKERISRVLEIPLLFMDSVHVDNLAESWNDIKRVLYWVKKVRGCGSVLFHPCVMATKEENFVFYKSFIDECRRLNVPLLAVEDIFPEAKLSEDCL